MLNERPSDYGITEPERTAYSSYFKGFGPDGDQGPDDETLEQLAGLMGIDLDEIRAKVAESERLHHLAWKKKRNSRRDQRASAITNYEKICEFDGRQLFWQVGADQFLVNIEGRPVFDHSLKGALHHLACGA